MRNALADLPWVETNSIRIAFEQKLATFRVTDQKQFDMEEALKAVNQCEGYKANLVKAGTAIPTP